jgi:hypothetical protein
MHGLKECILLMTNDKQLCCKFEYLAVYSAHRQISKNTFISNWYKGVISAEFFKTYIYTSNFWHVLRM